MAARFSLGYLALILIIFVPGLVTNAIIEDSSVIRHENDSLLRVHKEWLHRKKRGTASKTGESRTTTTQPNYSRCCNDGLPPGR